MPYRIRRRMGMGRTGREARIAGQGQGARVTHRAPATSKHNDTATTPFHRAQAVNAQSGPMMLTHARTRARHTHTHTHTHTPAPRLRRRGRRRKPGQELVARGTPHDRVVRWKAEGERRGGGRSGWRTRGGGREEEDARRRTRGGGREEEGGGGWDGRSGAMRSGVGEAMPVFSSLVAPLAVPLLFARALFT